MRIRTVRCGDIGEEKKRIELVPMEEPAEIPVEPSPQVVPAAEPVPA